MKRIISNVMLVAAAATAFFSCQKQEVIAPETSQEVMLTFSSEKPAFDDETKTEWNGETIQWSKGDQIAIAYTVAGEWMGAKNEQTGNLMGTKLYKSTALNARAETAQFNVNSNFNIVKEGEHVFYGVYPAPKSTDFPNAPVASLEIPAVQTPTASSFDSSADLMTAISVDKFTSLPEKDEKISLRWTRLVAHANITLKTINGVVAGEKVLSVKLIAQEGANLVGKQNVNILTNEVVNNNEAANVLELSGSALSVAEGGNVEFWACVLPETLTSLTVVLDTDKATYTRDITEISKTFKQNARNILAINMADAKRDEKVVVPEDKTVTGTLTFDSGSKRIVSTTTQQVWSENDITLTYDKAGYNNNLAEYEKPVRFYANTTITIEAPGNIQSIDFACNTTTYANALKNSISGSSVKEKIVNVTLDASSSSVTYKMTAQVRMDALTVTYVKSESGETPEVPAEPVKLSAPVVKCSDSDITANSLKFTWDAVANASKYEVTFNNGTPTEITSTSYEATGLTANTKYTIAVKAVGDGVDYITSEASTFSATTLEQQGGDVVEPEELVTEIISGTFQYNSTNKTLVLTTASGLTITQSANNGNAVDQTKNTPSTLRVYRYNSLTFSGKTIKKIVIAHSASYPGANVGANTGTYTMGTTSSTWEGESDNVEIKNAKTGDTNKQLRPTSITVTYVK